MEPDFKRLATISGKAVFQSTGSVWSPTADILAVASSNAFQSTGSVWSPTVFRYADNLVDNISIHGLRVEPDALKV